MKSLLIALSILTGSAIAVLAEGPGDTPLLEVRATPVEIRNPDLDGLHLNGTVQLRADHPKFGGFSGLLVDSGHLIAISDFGWWLLADLDDRADGLYPVRAGFAPMRDSAGDVLDRGGRDAESLTIRDGSLVVGFERDHRIAFHIQDGKLGDDFYHRNFENLSFNKGLEGLATTPDGWLIAISERQEERGHPVFIVRYSGEVDRMWLPADSYHSVTGADVGPDGRLYVLKRDFSLMVGLSIRIERYELDEEGFPLPATRKVIARFDSISGIDNMEGISVWTDKSGQTRLSLISDDNYNAFQRTLLMDFTVLSDKAASSGN